VDNTDRGDFNEQDIFFLQALANTLAGALELHKHQEELRRKEALVRSMLEASPDSIIILSPEGIVLAMNQSGLQAMEIDDPMMLRDKSWESFWPDEELAKVQQALAAARAGETGRFEGFRPTFKGTPKWWDVVVAPIMADGAKPVQLISIGREITERVKAAEAKDQLLRDKDLLMREVHHRVKNSLQLVQTLLHLQSRSATHPEVRQQIDEAAGRIMTIGMVHQRLYQGGSVAESDAGLYLRTLLDDMAGILGLSEQGREIDLQVEPISLPADSISPLGLITTELVTNALKYGKGRVVVRVQRAEGGLEIIVEDEGPGFAEDFDVLQSRGLGMRLVSALARSGDASIRIDRTVPFGRIIAKLSTPAPASGKDH
ncbi:MAG: PAS domain-containing protein, partial [Acetobacteraceae bacterium]|nr:PAS domain-containing protein [Acetobacteraceae bacterium]